MASEILLIRHGETDSNARRIVQTPEAPLSERGRRQAALLAERLRAEGGIGAVLASDLARARETAQAAARATGCPLALEPLLQERSFGEHRGTAYEDLGVDIFAPGYVPPGGESECVFAERVAAAWRRVLEVARQTPGRLAVVTHGLVIGLLAACHCDPAGAALPGHWRNTSVTAALAEAPWRLLRIDCVAHLERSEEGSDGPGGTVA